MSSVWKHPNELIKLQRIKQKKKKLQARFEKGLVDVNSQGIPSSSIKENLSKRKNPFLKESDNVLKRNKLEEFASEDTIFNLLQTSETKEPKPQVNDAITSVPIISKKVLEEETQEVNIVKSLPIDWSLKTKLRILSNTAIPGSQLKTNQEASGLTSFVRCIDDKSQTGLDISPGSQFFQNTLYWEHPHLPWLVLFPRNSKLNTTQSVLGEKERSALMKDWTTSFTSLFRLLRTRQCPYFYVCANSFTVLFRAAGIGGRVETHALLTPTTRGIRAALRKDGIEFTMPLKKSTELQTSQDEESKKTDNNEPEEEEEEEEEEKWLESLGVSMEEIKKFQVNDSRKLAELECENDFSDLSLVLIEGFECQALFNFLLNAKSTTINIGKLAGVPPTLLSPVAFQGATLKNLNFRSSKVRMDNSDFFSMELTGTILPHIIPSLNFLMQSHSDMFSASMVNTPSTLAFSKASEILIQNVNKESNTQSNFVFGRENLSDCGLPNDVVEQMCKVDKNSIQVFERFCYKKDQCGYLIE